MNALRITGIVTLMVSEIAMLFVGSVIALFGVGTPFLWASAFLFSVALWSWHCK